MIPGIDIVSVLRIEQALSRFGDAFAARILTPKELDFYRLRVNRAQFLAGRFAAKEAVYKAAGIPNLTWQRVLILPEGKQPTVWIDQKKREDIRVSISHEQEFAVAVAIRVADPEAD